MLYFGDHPYTDLADVRLHHGWRTGAILWELDVSGAQVVVPALSVSVVVSTGGAGQTGAGFVGLRAWEC